MELSVVILNYNVRYFLEQCIRSVQKAIANLEAEIIIIDNNSPDDSCDMVKSKFRNITLIENKENVGFSKANNQAVKIAKGKYVCILNPDTAVSEDCFEKSLSYYKNQKNIGSLGVFLMDGTGNFLPESKRNFPSPKTSLLKLLGQNSRYYAEHLNPEEQGSVEVLVGAFMLMTKSIYDEVGGFDEDYFMYGEDIDLSYKITKAGYENHYLGDAIVLHYKGESTKRDDAYYDRFYGAMQIFYRKHVSQSRLEEKSVALGVSMAKKVNRYRHKSKKQENSIIEKYCIFSDNQQFIHDLNRQYQTNFEQFLKKDFQNMSLKNAYIVFDANYLSYSEIFDCMRRLCGKNNSFRIRPPASNYLIGSDRSDEKGEVVLFHKNNG